MNLKKLFLALAIGILPVGEKLFAAPPNIIFILVDDQGWGDVGILFQKNRRLANERTLPAQSTPNLDKFAAEGAQLRDHYCAAPVCAPSRASILLGVSQGHANVRDNQFDKALENDHTLATVLKQAGYATIAIGKWGLQGGSEGKNAPGNPMDWEAYPTRRGFDDFFGYIRHVDGHEHYPKEAVYFNDHKSREVWMGSQNEAKNITPDLDKCYTADLWTAWAKHWIVEHQGTNSTQPFFMYLAYDTPHAVQELPTREYPTGGGLRGGMQWLGTPHHMITTAVGKIDSWIHPDYRDATYDDDHNAATPEVPWPNVYKRYATAIRRIDDAVGDIAQLLKDLRIDNDTLVIFTSDNGPSIESYIPKEPLRADFFDSYGPFDGIKRDCWEGGERVPALVRWPGHVPSGTIVTRPSISYDWMRTFAEAANLPQPAIADGVSLLPELTGKGAQRDRGYVYVEYFENGRTPNYAKFAAAHRNRKREQMQFIRIGDFTGVRYDVKSQADPFEIYDVTKDPKEANNLAAQMPALEQKMKSMALQVRRSNATAPRPYDNELVPAVFGIAVTNGVEWKTYNGAFPWVPDFETLTADASGFAERPDLSKAPKTDAFGMFFTGLINAPRDGEYTFYLQSDFGAVLRIHDATVVDVDSRFHPREAHGSIRLQAGLHPFRLYYARANGTFPPLLDFSWSGPEIAKQKIPETTFVHPKQDL